MALEIIKLGHPVLRKQTQEVSRETLQTAKCQSLIDHMIKAMREGRGVGLAAPQVGESLQLCIVESSKDDQETDTPIVLVNPKIVFRSAEKQQGWEGCLSVDNLRGMVKRACEIRVDALDRNGCTMNFAAQDFRAVVLQHEIDHLAGILYLDRMENMSTLTQLDEWEKYWLTQDESEDTETK